MLPNKVLEINYYIALTKVDHIGVTMDFILKVRITLKDLVRDKFIGDTFGEGETFVQALLKRESVG